MAENTQVQTVTSAQDTTQPAVAPTAEQAVDADTAAIKADIDKIQAAIDDLKAKGEDFFADTINNLEQKKADAEAKLQAKVTETVTTAETAVSSWWADHKADIFNYTKIAALVYIAARLTM